MSNLMFKAPSMPECPCVQRQDRERHVLTETDVISCTEKQQMKLNIQTMHLTPTCVQLGYLSSQLTAQKYPCECV